MQGSDPKQDRATAQQVMSIIDGSASPEDSDIERTMKELINNEYPESENHAESKSGKGKSASGSSKFNEASILAGQKEVSALASETAQKFKRPLSSARVGGDPSNMAFNQISPPNHEDIVASNDQFSDISKLKDFLSSIRVPERPKAKPMDISKVLTPDVLLPLFQDENLCQGNDPAIILVVFYDYHYDLSLLSFSFTTQTRVKSLFPYLPEGVPKTVDELEGTVKSPQFVQALRSLSYALESGQMSSLAQSFDLPPVALTSVEDFLKAIKDKFGKEQKNIDQDGDSLMKE
ncbi:Proteasomal ubiquitin receptor ADRM1 [Zancudomyces culisetae]|uniref:Proteasomal ubiquitin receptor ADRM1 n=1 Tax=Zancudomyces culisetae TaxID=1213189 RepID=A0A1R1PGN8_ZANCU|nr:Proteasomal ubiquitin receptor ADRM1 [Zancudomyces culisetae]|eukprot:OMH80140.1 Proteasomal ubiquitin receptor ADRM1 [Zancudomyces culisetae]